MKEAKGKIHLSEAQSGLWADWHNVNRELDRWGKSANITVHYLGPTQVEPGSHAQGEAPSAHGDLQSHKKDQSPCDLS
jgi:hypothetical protein